LIGDIIIWIKVICDEEIDEPHGMDDFMDECSDELSELHIGDGGLNNKYWELTMSIICWFHSNNANSGLPVMAS
jgi:hypothetical protein